MRRSWAVLAVTLAFALGTRADFLYWMVSSDNEVAFDYAMVRLDGQQVYLPLHEGSTTYSEIVEFGSDETGLKTFGADSTGIYVDLLGNLTGSSFLIELYAESGKLLGQSELASYEQLLAAQHIVRNAQSQVAAPWAPAFAPVPEPTSGLLTLLGLAALALRRKRADGFE